MTPPEPDEPYTPPPGELAVPKPQPVLAPDIQPRQPHPHPASHRIRSLADDLDTYRQLPSDHSDMERAVGVELMALGSQIRDERPTAADLGLNTSYDTLQSSLRAAREVTEAAHRQAARRVAVRFFLVLAVSYCLGLVTGYLLHGSLSAVITSGVTVVLVTLWFITRSGRMLG